MGLNLDMAAKAIEEMWKRASRNKTNRACRVRKLWAQDYRLDPSTVKPLGIYCKGVPLTTNAKFMVRPKLRAYCVMKPK